MNASFFGGGDVILKLCQNIACSISKVSGRLHFRVIDLFPLFPRRMHTGPVKQPDTQVRLFRTLGLLKLSIIELAEAGANDAEVQAMTGQSADMVACYRAKASRKALSKSGQERRE